MACSYYCMLRPYFLLALSSLPIRPCVASPQSLSPRSTSNTPNPTNAAESPIDTSQGNVIVPNGGPSTGTKPGLAVGIVLGIMLIGILAWLFFQCFPHNRNRNKKGTTDPVNKMKAVELEDDTPGEWLAEPCERHSPVPIARLAAPPGRISRTDVQRVEDEGRKSDDHITVTVPGSPQQTRQSYGFLRDSSIRVGESAMTPEASIIEIRIPTLAATSVSSDPELSYLRREMAMVQEQRVRLERLEQLHALRQREDQLQTAIYLREYGGK